MKVKVLIIRFSSIGDIVLTSPVIRCLKQQLQGEIEIHYLTKNIYASLLAENPYLSKVYTIEKSTNEVDEALQAEQYDYIVDLHKNLRSSRVKKKLDGFSFTFNKLNWQKWLLVNLKINQMPEIHIVDRYLDAVKALGITNDEKGLDYFLPKGVEHTNQKLRLNFQHYTVIVLGATHATKRLPINQLKKLVESVKGNIVLVGGKEDSECGDEVRLTDTKRIFNAAGKTTLHESAFLIKKSTRVYSHDTGMMHIAAAFQKEIVSIWGNTVPEFGMYPYLNKANKQSFTVIENKDLACRPCSKIGFDKCPKGHFKCMENLNF